MSEVEPQLVITEVEVPAHVSLDGLFWVDPSMLGNVDNMINSAHLPTMALGVESRSTDFVDERSLMAAVMISPDDPLYAEKQRALDVGFMYGTILSDSTQESPGLTTNKPAGTTPQGFIADLMRTKDGLDLGMDWHNNLLFMRLRDLEVKYAGSDVLAFCLSKTQAHMARLFRDNHKGEQQLNNAEITQLQSLYYAGVLAGALATTHQELPLEPIEITRSRLSRPELIMNIKLELDLSDSLEDAIDDEMRSKLMFKRIQTAKGKPAVSVTPGNLQYGPNTKSMALPYIPGAIEVDNAIVFDAKSINALVVEDRTEEVSGRVKIKLIKDAQGYLRDKQEEDKHHYPQDKIVGIVGPDDIYVSAIDASHPWSPAISKLVNDGMFDGDETVGSQDSFLLWQDQRPSKHPSDNRLLYSTVGAYMVMPWLYDIVGSASRPNFNPRWDIDLRITISALVVGGLVKAAQIVKQRGAQTIERFDAVWQRQLDMQTLHEPRNSGTILSE